MKFKDIKNFQNEYRELKKEFRWEIEDWIKEQRLGYCYVRARVDSQKIKIEMTKELSAEEIKGLQNKFGMILALKQVVKTENICYDIPMYPVGSSSAIYYTFQLGVIE